MTDDQQRASMARAVGLARFWLPVAAWMLLIFIVSGRPDQNGGLSVGVVIPKLAHVVEYAVLGFLLARAARVEDEPLGSWRSALVILAIGLYAVSDEVHQAFVPSREARVTDVIIDLVGGLMGVIAWRSLARLWRRTLR